jgi:hypothetical protein
VKENSNKSNINILGKLGQALHAIGKPLMIWISWRSFGKFFRPNVREISNFE